MTSNDRSINILIADDHQLFREGIREILTGEGDFAVVGEAGDGAAAVAWAARTRPDVILLDVEMPGPGVLATVRRIRELSPLSRVIILTMHDDARLVHELLNWGICGFLLKNVPRRDLITAIRTSLIDADRIVLSVSRESLAPPAAADNRLSAREREVLQLTAAAMTNAQIATRLSLTEATVKRHLRNIFAKLDAVSRIDAVNKALEASLISRPQPVPEPRLSRAAVSARTGPPARPPAG